LQLVTWSSCLYVWNFGKTIDRPAGSADARPTGKQPRAGLSLPRLRGRGRRRRKEELASRTMDCTSVDLVRKIPGPGWRWRSSKDRQHEHVRVRKAATRARCSSLHIHPRGKRRHKATNQRKRRHQHHCHRYEQYSTVQCTTADRGMSEKGDALMHRVHSPPNRAEEFHQFHARVVTSLFRDAAQHNNNVLPAAGRSLNPDDAFFFLCHGACNKSAGPQETYRRLLQVVVPRQGQVHTKHTTRSPASKPNPTPCFLVDGNLGLSFPTLPLRSQVSIFSLDDFLFFYRCYKARIVLPKKNTRI
jgi:hypothetical protein